MNALAQRGQAGQALAPREALWIRASVLCQQRGYSSRSLQRKGKHLRSRLNPATGETEFSSLDLPGEVAAACLAQLEAEKATGLGERVDLPEELKAKAEKIYATTEPLVEFLARPRALRRFRTANGRILTRTCDVAAYLAQQAGVSVTRLWQRKSNFDAAVKSSGNGMLGLVKPRSDRGVSRVFAKNPRALAYLKSKYLDEKLDNADLVYDVLVRDWKQIGGQGEPPSLATVRRQLAKLPAPLGTLAHHGPRAWLAECSPFVQRERPPVMEWWVSDHRELDVFVRNTLFPEKRPQQRITLCLTAIYDWGSTKLLGFTFAPIPSSRTLGSAFRMAAMAAGALAPNFLWDNGEDYKRFERILTAPEMAGVFQPEITRAQPYRPRSKPVESWFNRWSQRFDLLWRPGWRGRKPGDCPEDCREAQKQHDAWLKGKAAASPFVSDFDFILAAVEYIEEYNATAQKRLGGRSPNEVFDAAHPAERRGRIDARLLGVLFWQRVKRVVQAGGCVQLNKALYEPTDESLISMDLLQGQSLVIKYDPYNRGQALALDGDGRLVGELRAQKWLTQSAHGRESEDAIRAAERRRTKLLRHYQDYLNGLAWQREEMGWETEAARLVRRGRERLALPATGTDGAAVAVVAPGALGACEVPSTRRLASAFTGDDAEADRELWEREGVV